MSEHGVHYVQTVSYDPLTQMARLHVPKHHDIDEAIMLLHKPSGLKLGGGRTKRSPQRSRRVVNGRVGRRGDGNPTGDLIDCQIKVK